MKVDVLVVGAGPAGATCAMLAARMGFSVTLVDRMGIGGQLINIHSIKNYPGIADIAGWDLSAALTDQVMESGVNTELGTVETLTNAGGTWTAQTDSDSICARAVVIATGGSPAPVPHGEKYEGRGISYCATCDGPLYRGKPVAVIGGGDFAMSEVSFLAGVASDVYVLHPDRALTAAAAWQSEVKAKPNVKLLPSTELAEVTGENGVEGITYVTLPDRTSQTLPVSAVFGATGLVPNSSVVRDLVKTDDSGFIITDENLATSQAGIFAVGDVRSGSAMLVANAVGEGTRAALSVAEYLNRGR